MLQQHFPSGDYSRSLLYYWLFSNIQSKCLADIDIFIGTFLFTCWALYYKVWSYIFTIFDSAFQNLWLICQEILMIVKLYHISFNTCVDSCILYWLVIMFNAIKKNLKRFIVNIIFFHYIYHYIKDGTTSKFCNT